jgi:phage gp46-like protein
MPLTSGTGVDISITRSGTTGRWDILWDATGNPQFADDRSHLVLSLLLEYRGLWWADPTGRRGSTLYLVKQDVAGTTSQILQAVDLALAPALDDKRLSSVTRTCQRLSPGKYKLVINWVTPSGVKGTIPLSLSS